MARKWEEHEWVTISALQHYAYCPRQCALIHLEQIFQENVFTLRGRRLHEKADTPEAEIQGNIRIERALPLVSHLWGIHGKADIVEFDEWGVPYPVEYKQGRRKDKAFDQYQVCAQALCLEEMLQVQVPKGAIYYYSSRRRREILFDQDLRKRTQEVILKTREILQQDLLPPPQYDARCHDCSLQEACLPLALTQWAARSSLPDVFSLADETEEAL